MLEFKISLPIFDFILKGWQWFEKKMLLETYKTSHREYNKAEVWFDLSQEFKAILRLEKAHINNKEKPQSYLGLASKDKKYDWVKISFSAKNWNNLEFQDNLTFYNLGTTPIIKSLPSIPLQNISISDEGEIIIPYNTIIIKVIEASINGEVENINCSKMLSPSYFELLNCRFKFKWGKMWNMRLIDDEIRELKLFFETKLIFPYRQKYFGVCCPEESKFHVMKWPSYLLCKILSIKLIRWLYFWMPILLKRRELNAYDSSNQPEDK